ncbi:phosphotransferase [Jiangella anatolica]|uniref:Phosphotransferase n=1 Tax=Jiangella anatolica TaxID=2670374 RepID=A0A2W2CLR4_9ACTN|nr:aminoglycoside phosphotransferase family protein [Jiangella anatolica]PZF86276.1 phosphotransferase [Jiangella anatolica]
MTGRAPAGPLLTADTVVGFLRDRGVLDGSPATAGELAGGVSSVVLRVDTSARSVVVKQALPRLRVRAEWWAKRERTLSEAAALAVYHDLTPGRVPEVVAVDESLMALVLQAAPPDAASWKSVLLTDPHAVTGDVPELLGETLGRWHRGTRGRPELLDRFQDDEAFDQLRLTPFHREVQRHHPAVADALEACLDDLTVRRDCLVHGDFSPKNVLVGGDLCWIVDAEVAKAGAPAFDVAFMTAHLMLKSVLASRPRVFRAAAGRFAAAYQAEAGAEAALPLLGWHVAALLLARVDGRSPVDYLTAARLDQVRRAALRVLRGTDPSTADVWDALEER